MKRAILLLAVGISAACASSAALARVDVGVFFGIPGPVYEAPPVVYYEPPPSVVYQAPPVVYQPGPVYYGYGYRHEYWEHRRWHDNGWHRGWEHRHDREGDDD